MTNKKIAVILFNLGGPDNKESIKPFLFNLFYDKHIINLPCVFRYLLAWIISSSREKTAQEIYSHIGYKSPILEETNKQAELLEKTLRSDNASEFKVFVCMRHWHPMSDEVTVKVKNYAPDEVILLPLYPQFSTTTTLSSVEDFKSKIKKHSIRAICKVICCYSDDEYFIKSHFYKINEAIKSVKNKDNFRILFSAHGLPKKIIEKGDPYQWQIENTVNSIVKLFSQKELDYKITYQSKVGPLEWIKPNTEDEIMLACEDKKEIIIVPIAFVSEHSETLVELDIEYKITADKYGINYIRVPTISVDGLFIESLRNIVMKAVNENSEFIGSNNISRICPKNFSKCMCNI